MQCQKCNNATDNTLICIGAETYCKRCPEVAEMREKVTEEIIGSQSTIKSRIGVLTSDLLGKLYKEYKEKTKEKPSFKGTKCRVPGCLMCKNDDIIDPQTKYSKKCRMVANNVAF